MTPRFARSAPIYVLVIPILFLVAVLVFSAGIKKHLNRTKFDAQFESSENDKPVSPQELATQIQTNFLEPPSGGPYKLHSPNTTDFSQNGQSLKIAKIFNNMRGGVFIEAGAYNGEDLSNTLYLERELNWTGLLVEPDPWNYWSLRNRGRKSHSIPACISPDNFSKQVTFKQSDAMGHIARSNEAGGQGIYTSAKCFPLYSLILAMKYQTVHLLSLDLEGIELKILKSLPWDKVDIKVLLVEFAHVEEGVAALVNYMRSRGYRLHSTVGVDHIYIKRRFFQKLLRSSGNPPI